MNTTKNLGQYFTKDITLKEKLYEFIKNNPNEILEPSIGQGDLVEFVTSKISNIKFDCYEIDNTIKLLNENIKVTYGDFLLQNINKKYKTIIGNPPYVKTKKGNLYIDFISKCYNLLDDKGELIMIIPSDFFKKTSSSKLLNLMTSTGSFTDIYHPHDEKLFESATIDVLIFRYVLNEFNEKIKYNNIEKLLLNNNGSITFNDNLNTKKVSDVFNVYVGIVSGKDEVFCNSKFGNIDVLVGENLCKKFILIKKFPTDNNELNDYMVNNKLDLLSRRIKKFNESNWFEWGALRNYDIVHSIKGNDCIFIYNLTRKDKVSFLSKVQFFGGNLLMLVPKFNVIDLQIYVDYFNSDLFKNNYMYSGRFKIGHKQLCDSTIL